MSPFQTKGLIGPVRRCILIFVSTLIVLGLILPTGVVLSQTGERTLTQEELAAVEAIADIVSSQNDMTGELLREIGYEHPFNERVWEEFPAIRKVEAAFDAAENAEIGGGKKMLALLAKRLSLEYESVRQDPILTNWIELGSLPGQTATGDEALSFSPRIVEPTDIDLPKDIRGAISRITLYSDAGALGGPQSILRYQFGLQPDEVYEILRTSPSNRVALEIGLSRSPIPPTLRTRLRDLVFDIQAEYEGARVDEDLNRVINDATLDVSPGNATDGFEQNRYVPGRSYIDDQGIEILESGPEALARIRPNLPSTSPSPSSYSAFATNASQEALDAVGAGIMQVGAQAMLQAPFQLLTAIPAGFGGVVFGNSVTDQDLPQVASIFWLPDQNSLHNEHLPAGVLEFTFVDGTQRLVAPVLQEDMYAAYTIVYSGIGEIPALSPGSGVGLVGLDGFRTHYEVTSEGLQSNGRRANAILHPALADMDIGWSVAFVDWFPAATSDVLNKVNENIKDESEIQAVKDWITSDYDIATWKVIDVPLIVESDGYLLSVKRIRDTEHNYADELAREAYIDIQGFGSFGSVNSEWSQGFYPLVPTLTHAIYDYERVNTLAKVLALVRWAKNDGATFMNPPLKPDGPPTPGSLILTDDDEIVAAPTIDEMKIYRGLATQILAQMEDIAADGSEILQVLYDKHIDLYREIRTEHNHAWEAVNSADFQRLLTEWEEVQNSVDQVQTDNIETWLANELRQSDADAWQEYQQLQADIEEQDEIYWGAESGSQEEANALERKEELEQKATDLLVTAFPPFANYQQLQVDIEEQDEIYWGAESGSQEEADALERKEELEQKATDLLATAFPALVEQGAQLQAQADQLEKSIIAHLDETFPAFTEFQQALTDQESLHSIPKDIGDWLATELREIDTDNWQEYQRLQADIEEQDEIYWGAESGSQEEADALERKEELEQKVDDILVTAFPPFADYQRLQAELEEVQNSLEQVQNDDIKTWLAAELREIDANTWQEYQQLQAEIEEQDEIYWGAESGSQEEVDALERKEELEQKVDDILVTAFPPFADYQQLQAEIDEQDEIYWDAESGSREEADALERKEELEQEAATFITEAFPAFSEQDEQFQAQAGQLEKNIDTLLSDAFPAFIELEEQRLHIDLWIQLSEDLERVISEENGEILSIISLN